MNILTNAKYRKKYALISDCNEKVTYGDLTCMVEDLSKVVVKNTIVLFIMHNDISSVVFYLTCLRVGVTPIIVNKDITQIEIDQYIQQYEPEYIFALLNNVKLSKMEVILIRQTN